jgi:hypothetical protein
MAASTAPPARWCSRSPEPSPAPRMPADGPYAAHSATWIRIPASPRALAHSPSPVPGAGRSRCTRNFRPLPPRSGHVRGLYGSATRIPPRFVVSLPLCGSRGLLRGQRGAGAPFGVTNWTLGSRVRAGADRADVARRHRRRGARHARSKEMASRFVEHPAGRYLLAQPPSDKCRKGSTQALPGHKSTSICVLCAGSFSRRL